MSSLRSFLWFDFETFGADPMRDRPSQFAAVRTDADLNEIGEPVMWYCAPSIDVLPHPDAVLLTGITPQQADRLGVPEPQFAAQIHKLFAETGTCGAGYNSIRFDDEVIRHLFYRNFYDPYQREWYGENSRWDLLDVVRLWHALRPDGFCWPKRADGATSFKLEHLSQANDLLHDQAHDALSDVRATIAIARQLKLKQPRLFQHALMLRDKQFAAQQFDLPQMAAVLHVSAKIPAERGCITVIAPIAMHPTNRNCVLCFDLSQDPTALLSLAPAELAERIFARREDLPEGVERIAVKGVHLNKSPMLAPLKTLTAADAQRWGINLAQIETHRQWLLGHQEALIQTLTEVYLQADFAEQDPELALYQGFLPKSDGPRLAKVRNAGAEALAQLQGQFEDRRYNELLLRYRARHHPFSLNDDERAEWQSFVHNKLLYDSGIASLTYDEYRGLIAAKIATETDAKRLHLLEELRLWPQDCGLSQFLSTQG